MDCHHICGFNDTFKMSYHSGRYSMKDTVILSPSDFSGRHLNRSGTLTVLFAAEWCPFCRRFTPIFHSALAQERLTRASANLTDLDNPLWEAFDIEVVPTVMVFKDGEVVYRRDGALGQGLPDDAMKDILSILHKNSKPSR
jgi:thioredoxin 1